MNQAKAQRQIDNAHRALGHYIAEFSQLMALMRWCMASRLAGEPEREIAEIPMGEMHPAQITGAFFQMCRQTNDLNDDEKKVEKWLRTRITEAIEDRNNYAHADWWIGLPGATRSKLSEPWTLRIKPRPSEDRAAKFAEVPTDELDKKAEELMDLLPLLQMFGLVCLEQTCRAIKKPGR